jgi:hypothetical protein
MVHLLERLAVVREAPAPFLKRIELLDELLTHEFNCLSVAPMREWVKLPRWHG